MPARTRRTSSKPKVLPKTFTSFRDAHPGIVAAHEQAARAAFAAGPLDRKTCELVKIGIALGAGLESALRSHVRQAREHGAAEAEIEQVMLLGVNTVGFSRAVSGWRWAQETTARTRR